jgi:hypothetical protein
VPLFWLTYRYPKGRVVRYPNGRVAGVVVIESGDLLHARLKAALTGADRELEFASGHQLDPESAHQVPVNMLGRRLNRSDLRKLRQMLLKKKPPAPSVRRQTATKPRVWEGMTRRKGYILRCRCPIGDAAHVFPTPR